MARTRARLPIRELVWERDGGDWPNHDASGFVQAAGLRWHVQQLGHGPTLLLVHGTGGSTHSWRVLAARLARRFRVVAPDLPGHGFTSRPGRRALTLPGMARALGALLEALETSPVLAVGHSAGAAVVCRMSLDGQMAPRALMSLNGAFLPLAGTRSFFSPLARLLVRNPLVPWLGAWRARDPVLMTRLLGSTGSRIPEEDLRLYGRLARSPHHVAATLGMMASWDLEPLVRDLPRLIPPLRLVVGERDRFIPPSDAEQVAARVPSGTVVRLAGLGHLAHEERPEAVGRLVEALADEHGVC